jgi:hypothetical protein
MRDVDGHFVDSEILKLELMGANLSLSHLLNALIERGSIW